MYISSVKFSLWCDFIERSFLNEDFNTLIADEIINGATSNPAIFEQAFSSPAYHESKSQLLSKSLEAKQIYEKIALEDIKLAASKLLPLYEKDDDGFVSLEIDPFLAKDVDLSIAEGKRLYENLNMPNVMIKVPATPEGYLVMEALYAQGININATLIFSQDQTLSCLKAFENGLEEFRKSYPNKKAPKAVISIFVSRFDRKLDPIMQEKNLSKSKIGIFNATKLYKIIENAKNENLRALFASTGVKDKDLAQEYYIDKLLYPNTINTAPLKTIETFIASGTTSVQNVPSDEEIEEFFTQVKNAGIDMEKVSEELLAEGLKAFENSFKTLLNSLGA